MYRMYSLLRKVLPTRTRHKYVPRARYCMASDTVTKHQRLLRTWSPTLRVSELQGIITILFCKIAGVADLFTVIDAAYFLTIFGAGYG